jgi:hypothetical protein
MNYIMFIIRLNFFNAKEFGKFGRFGHLQFLVCPWPILAICQTFPIPTPICSILQSCFDSFSSLFLSGIGSHLHALNFVMLISILM